MMDLVFKTMDFVLKMMDFVLKMMDFVLRMMNLSQSAPNWNRFLALSKFENVCVKVSGWYNICI